MNNPLRNILIAAFILLALFIITSKKENATFTKSNSIFSSNKTDISKIMIQQGQNSIQINKIDTTWHIAGNDTLVIRQNRIEDLFGKVLDVKRTTIRSKKESNWINYSVDDSTGTHLALINTEDKTIGYYIFGRSKTDWAHNFVRIRIGENLSEDVLKNVYETSESVIHHLNTSTTYWGEKNPVIELESIKSDSLGVGA
ncbi:MAG: hypothetical protein CMF96_10480 [Candidatus Marinimicrobia bacterium]|nr:hypothetical protein [Candidatus Neomarinimicrobiota bacterium]